MYVFKKNVHSLYMGLGAKSLFRNLYFTVSIEADIKNAISGQNICIHFLQNSVYQLAGAKETIIFRLKITIRNPCLLS